MSKGGSTVGFMLTLLGGIVNIIVSVNLIDAYYLKQAFAAYYAVLGAMLCMLSFRIKRARTVRSASVAAIVFSLLSANPISFVGGVIGLFKRVILQQPQPLALYSFKPKPMPHPARMSAASVHRTRG